VLCIISVSLVCLDYFPKYLASQAVSNDVSVEEYISTKISCMRVREPLNKAVHMNCFDVFIIVLVTVIF